MITDFKLETRFKTIDGQGLIQKNFHPSQNKILNIMIYNFKFNKICIVIIRFRINLLTLHVILMLSFSSIPSYYKSCKL